MRISTLRQLLNFIKESPDVSGLERIELDNIACEGLTTLRAVTYTDGPYVIIEHHPEQQPDTPVTAHQFYDALNNTLQYRQGLSKDSLFFVGDQDTPPRVKCVDGVLYLRYIEPLDERLLTKWTDERIM